MKSIILDDNKEYLIIDNESIDGTKYTLFSDIENPTNICFRKIVTEEENEYYVGLDDKKEFEKVSLFFARKLNNRQN